MLQTNLPNIYRPTTAKYSLLGIARLGYTSHPFFRYIYLYFSLIGGFPFFSLRRGNEAVLIVLSKLMFKSYTV